ncbi:18292_t:CDS:2, partial [Entrophospora sp. SA101]
LALHLYAISPSQAVCEHNFSTLKWMYGDYQTKLNIYKVEAMCKIHSYYISNLDKELKDYGNMSYDPSALVENIMNQDDLENN